MGGWWITCKVNKTCILAPWWRTLMPHLLHFLLDLCMHHCKLGGILHLSCAKATHGLQDAMFAGQCAPTGEGLSRKGRRLWTQFRPDLSDYTQPIDRLRLFWVGSSAASRN